MVQMDGWAGKWKRVMGACRFAEDVTALDGHESSSCAVPAGQSALNSQTGLHCLGLVQRVLLSCVCKDGHVTSQKPSSVL